MEQPLVNKPDSQLLSQNLVQLIKQLIKERHYEGVALLFTSPTEAARNLKCIDEVSMELLHDVCLQHLTTTTYETDLALYSCAEELLKILSMHAPPEELLLELLEIIEEQRSEYVFTSALRALQMVLLRLGDSKPRSLEWSLNSIHTHLEELPLPEYLKDGYDEKQARLLEQNEQVQQLLMHYITVGLFFEPLLKDATQKQRMPDEIFRDCGINRRNILCCFFVKLLGKPLALLDLTTKDERRTNAYSVQCAVNLTKAATQCIVDPYYFLPLVEQRARWKRRLAPSKDIFECSSSNIFLIEEKVPLEGLAIYFYMLLVEEVGLSAVPKVYTALFVFEMGLYLVSELLSQDEPALQYRALLLASRLLENLQKTEIPELSLELEVHQDFCHALCHIVGYSSQTQLRQQGVQLLRKYIHQFDSEGKYLVLKNLLRSVSHNGISGYLAILYKDFVANALVASPTTMLPTSFSGKDFRSIFLQNICRLPHGAATDLMEYADKVISSLNALRFFAIKDCHNRTGFWDFIADIEKQFLNPLREGLDMSIAHYKAELQRIEKGVSATEDSAQREQLQLLDISIANATSEKSKADLDLDRSRQMSVLGQNLCTFDLMRSLLARATECVENSKKNLKSKRAVEQVNLDLSSIFSETQQQQQEKQVFD